MTTQERTLNSLWRSIDPQGFASAEKEVKRAKKYCSKREHEFQDKMVDVFRHVNI